MRTDELPVALFKIHMQLPKVGVAEQPLTACLKLDHDVEKSTTPEPPTVLLKKCSIQLQALTYVQCIRDGLFPEGDGQRDWDTDHHIASVDISERPESAPTLAEHLDLLDLRRIAISSRFTPTFSTDIIFRTYKLHLKLTVERVRKTLKAELITQDFILPARDYMPTGEDFAGAPSLSAVE